MLAVLVGLLTVAEFVGFSQAVVRMPLQYDFVKRSFSEHKQKRHFDGPDTLYNLDRQYPLRESANPGKQELAVQPLKVTVFHALETVRGS